MTSNNFIIQFFNQKTDIYPIDILFSSSSSIKASIKLWSVTNYFFLHQWLLLVAYTYGHLIITLVLLNLSDSKANLFRSRKDVNLNLFFSARFLWQVHKLSSLYRFTLFKFQSFYFRFNKLLGFCPTRSCLL